MARSKARRHFAVDKLSEEGRELVVGMLSVDVGRRPPYMEIIGALRNRTGEEISLSSLSRYYHAIVLSRLEEEKEHWKTTQEIREAIKTAIREAPDSDADEIATALLNSTVIMNRDKISDLDMETLLVEQRKRETLKLNREKLDLAREKLAGSGAEDGPESKRNHFLDGCQTALKVILAYSDIEPLLKKNRDQIVAQLEHEAEVYCGAA